MIHPWIGLPFPKNSIFFLIQHVLLVCESLAIITILKFKERATGSPPSPPMSGPRAQERPSVYFALLCLQGPTAPILAPDRSRCPFQASPLGFSDCARSVWMQKGTKHVMWYFYGRAAVKDKYILGWKPQKFNFANQ